MKTLFKIVIVLAFFILMCFNIHTAVIGQSTKFNPQFSILAECKEEWNGVTVVWMSWASNYDIPHLGMSSYLSQPLNPSWWFIGHHPTSIFTGKYSRLWGVKLIDGAGNRDEDLSVVWTVWTVLAGTKSVTISKDVPNCQELDTNPDSTNPLNVNIITAWSVIGNTFRWEIQDDFGNWHPVVDEFGMTLYTTVDYKQKYNSSIFQIENVAMTRLAVNQNQPTDPNRYRLYNENDELTGVWIDFNNFDY